MRPIYWGVIWFFIGMVGWVAFSVVYGVIGGLSGGVPAEGWFFVYLFGLIFFFSLPVAIIAEVVRWYRRKKTTKGLTPRAYQSSRPDNEVYCYHCGQQVRPSSSHCDHCGTRL